MSEIENLKIDGGSTYTVGNQDIIANGWEAGKTYVKNRSYVIQEHRLYVCNVTHTSVEPFDTTKWTEITIGDAIGNNIGDLSQLTTTDKSSLVGAVNSMMIKTNGAWTANSSSAYGTTLTDSINVTKGVWLITWGHPSQSANLGCFVDGIATNSDITDQFMSLDNGLAYTKGCILVRFTGNSTIKLCAGGSTSVSFSDIGRGFLRAIKLK